MKIFSASSRRSTLQGKRSSDARRHELNLAPFLLAATQSEHYIIFALSPHSFVLRPPAPLLQWGVKLQCVWWTFSVALSFNWRSSSDINLITYHIWFSGSLGVFNSGATKTIPIIISLSFCHFLEDIESNEPSVNSWSTILRADNGSYSLIFGSAVPH